MSEVNVNNSVIVKQTLIVLLGTLLEYYDFLLFAHLGFVITPLFFPLSDQTHSHILSLLLLGVSFVIRPAGGWFFGKISDKYGRKNALLKSITWIMLPAIGFAILPDYNSIGIVSGYIFVALRLIQGFAIGGEYPVAGTYLMEMHKKNQGLQSSLLVAIGSVGSLIGLGFAALCTLPQAPIWLWRMGFLLGGAASLVSYYIRKNFKENAAITLSSDIKLLENINSNRFLIFISGVLIGSTVWLPMTYSNFYVTKILNYDVSTGLYCSFIALISFILVLPFCGILFDKVNPRKYMLITTFLVGPICLGSFYLLTIGNITIAQMGLVFASALFGAPIHALMNRMFPTQIRGRNIGLVLMLGLSVGGLFPSISGYLVSKTRLDIMPALLVMLIATLVFVSYYKLFNKSEEV